MPLKKKGKGKGKGKSKGKAKGKKGKGKGKKGSKKVGEKADKELLVKEALAGARLWEARYEASEKSRQEYRENARRLVTQNEHLQNAVNQTERDTIEVIAFLKKEGTKTEDDLGGLRQTVKDTREQARREREELVRQYSQQISSLETQLGERNEEVRVMQSELKIMKEFRKKRAEMQQQLENLHVSLEEGESEHKTTVSQLEQRFFEEKLRLQKEANRRIADLAEKAHSEAVTNLDERTKEVYRENVQMADALRLHMEHEEALRKSKEQLEMANRQLVAEKELNQQLVKEKISQARHHKRLIRELQDKVHGLEDSLSVVVREFEEERRVVERRHKEELEAASSEQVTLQHRSDLQSREMNHVKRLARRILDQRTEVEQFFLDALAHVKKEIAANRAQYRRDAQVLYQQKMLEAVKGRGEFPSVRTFHPLETSTNSVYHDMEQAQKWDGLGGSEVDISDLTWEQREQVLRLLFAKMNQRPRQLPRSLPQLPSPPPQLPQLTAPEMSSSSDPVFLTERQQPAVDSIHTVSGQVT